MQSSAATSLGPSGSFARVHCRSSVQVGATSVCHIGTFSPLILHNHAFRERGGPHYVQASAFGVGRSCYQVQSAQHLTKRLLWGPVPLRKQPVYRESWLFRSLESKVLIRSEASCMLAVAQEGWSHAEGSTEEREEQAEPRKLPGDNGNSGAVIIGVRECNDGSVIFDFGRAEERPEHDPLEAFINGTALAEAGPSDSPAASTTSAEENGDLEALGEPLRLSNVVEDVESEDSSSSGELHAPNLRLRSGGALVPHPAKVQKGGEDAYFISQNDQSSYVGVSDGVGGWATLGVDAGLYSRELMFHCKRLSEDNILPRSILIRAHKMTQATGSATVMVARLQGIRLQIANLGDSGFLLVRDGEVALASTQMQHAFNFPFQIGSEGGDNPACAKDYECIVEPGDLLVLGTDGLFDNLFEKEIADAAVTLMNRGIPPRLASQHIAAFAQQRSLLKNGLSPFAVQADAAGFKHQGGKPDDVTVVIALVE